jgi:hypothetical protein
VTVEDAGSSSATAAPYCAIVSAVWMPSMPDCSMRIFWSPAPIGSMVVDQVPLFTTAVPMAVVESPA